MTTFFSISTIEAHKSAASIPSYPGRSPYNELFFVRKGHVIREMNLNTIRINPNELHLSLEEQITSIRSFSEDAEGFYCRFGNSFPEQLQLKDQVAKDLVFINSFMYRYPVRINKVVAERLANTFHALLQLQEEGGQSPVLMAGYLMTIIYELKQQLALIDQGSLSSKPFLITKQYRDLLIKHITNHRDIEFYASALGVTPNHLNKSVKKATGETAVELRNQTTLLEARLQLKQTNLPIGEIAYRLGFSELSYFSRFFKKAMGMTPLQYRES